jgi:uncharacterized membrane protein
MHWKRTLIIVLLAMFVAMFFSLLVEFMLSHGTGGNLHFPTQLLIVNTISAIALTSYFIGIEKLKRGGYLKVTRALRIIYIISFIFLFIPCFTHNNTHQNLTDLKIALAYHAIPFVVLLLFTFPLSLYLTRNKNKSTSQPAVSDAS